MRRAWAGAAALALGTQIGTTTVAEAAGGCGPGFHPNPWGLCRPNFYGPRFVRPAFYRPRFYDPGFYRPAFYGPGWGRPWGYRPVGWYGPRPWGFYGW